MPETRPGWPALAYLLLISVLAFSPGLGGPSRLTYHEAFVAQGAREILASGNWWHPSIAGLPWLEKPPLPFWLVSALGWCAGGVSPLMARLPSAAAATALVMGVALLATRHFGGTVGLLAGAMQATTAWTLIRGRLAEADMLLACLITWSLIAFDGLRAQLSTPPGASWRSWRWAFIGLLGATSMVKGTGFGMALTLSAVAVLLFWEGDGVTWRRLRFLPGWLVALALVLAWPVAMVVRHGPQVVGLWTLHVASRLGGRSGHGPFAGESWTEYVVNVVGQALPWAPLALPSALRSLARAWRGRRPDQPSGGGHDGARGDRLLWAWAVVPLVLVSLPGARNAHYAIHAQVPWSIWAAMGLEQLARRLVAWGWPLAVLRRQVLAGFASLAAACGLGFWLLGPWLDRRGEEWAFYEAAGSRLGAGEAVVLIYDDWDRDPYPTPFGPIHHDMAVRLFYLEHPACRQSDIRELVATEKPLTQTSRPLAVLGRERDLPMLARLGEVEILARGPAARWDRTYLLARIRPRQEPPIQQAGADRPPIR